MKRLLSLTMLVVALALAACDLDTLRVATPTSPVATEETATPEETARPAAANSPTENARPSPVAGKTPPPASAVLGCDLEKLAQGDPDSLGDPLYSGLGNSGYDAEHYTLDLAADMQDRTISGTTTIRARAVENLQTFNLDFTGLTIGDIAVNGASATYNRDGRELQITPGTPLKEGESFTVTVGYNGVPGPPQVDSGPLDVAGAGWTFYDGGVYVSSEPAGAANWFPVNDHPCDKASYTLRITVPEPYVVAANGLLKDTTDNGDTRTYLWETEFPMASYLVAVNIADFERETQETASGVPIRNYFPAGLDEEVKSRFQETPEMVEFLSEQFGLYPFEAYGVAVADTDLGFALETQTLSLFGNNMGSRRTSADEVVLHELAHQWFGDSISLKGWNDIWLNEGFATYAQWLWLEHKEGRSAYQERVEQMYNFIEQESFPPPGAPPADDLFNTGVYLRGGLTLHALRQEVGDEAFFRTLRTYYNRYKYGNASTPDFIAVAEEVSGKDLDSLFDGWLYAANMPPLP